MKGKANKIRTRYKSMKPVCSRCGNPIRKFETKCPFCLQKLSLTDGIELVKAI